MQWARVDMKIYDSSQLYPTILILKRNTYERHNTQLHTDEHTHAGTREEQFIFHISLETTRFCLDGNINTPYSNADALRLFLCGC